MIFSVNVNKQGESQLKSSTYTVDNVAVISAVYALQMNPALEFHCSVWERKRADFIDVILLLSF